LNESISIKIFSIIIKVLHLRKVIVFSEVNFSTVAIKIISIIKEVL